MAITTTLDKVRLEIGDTDPNAWLLTDDELNYFLAEEGDHVLRAAWRACSALAIKFARAYDFETDGQKFSRSQQYKAYSELSESLRMRVGALTVLKTTKVDGYSDDITSQDVLVAGTNVRRRYYGREDRTP